MTTPIIACNILCETGPTIIEVTLCPPPAPLVKLGQPPLIACEIGPTIIDVAYSPTPPTPVVEVGQPAILIEVVGSGVVPIPGPPGPSGVLQMIFGETPRGNIDGLNKDYMTTYPYSPNRLAVFLNGLRLRRTDDYIETGNQSFRFIYAPLPGDSLSIDYVQP